MRPFLLCLVIAAAPVSAGAQAAPADITPQLAQITGTVEDATGAPLPEARVTVAGPAQASARTGPNGSFEFQHLPPGEYQVVAEMPGFAPVTRTVTLGAGDITVLPLTLAVQILEHTMVTATKAGERDVQQTPIAISVLSGRDVHRQQAHTIEDVARDVPGVTFSQNTGFAQLTIRGIGTNVVFAGSDPSSAMYVDGVYIARPAMALSDLLDVERIEVLRGPQGTLYGRNAVGGAVNVVTSVPTNDFQASARIVAGTSGTLRGEAHVNGALVPGRVMASVAVLRGVARGFVRDLNHPNQFLGGEDVWAAQGKARVVLSPHSDLLFSADVTRQHPTPLTYAKVLAVKPGFHVDNPPDLHEVRTTTPGWSRNLQYGAAVRFTTTLTSRTTLTSLTAFRKLDYDVVVDTDITELDLTVSDTYEKHHQWSEELTLAHQQPKVSWMGGMFLFDDQDWQLSRIQIEEPRLENRLNPTVGTTSTAAFGQMRIALAPRVSATAGLRYTREEKTIRNDGQLLTLDLPVSPLAGSAYSYTDAMSRSAWTPKIALEIRHSERTLAYVSASRGFKSGGFNITSTEPGRGFAPEWAWSYEAGLKMTARNGRVQLNAATYHTDYSNLQVQTAIRPGVLDISNAAVATINGVEVEPIADVGSRLRVGGYLNWTDARYDRYIAVGVGGVTGDAAGHQLNNAPEWSGRAWLEWNSDVAGGGALSVRPEVVWQSTAFFTPFNDSIQRQSPYALVNVSADIGPRRGHVAVAAFARNIANHDYITGTFSSPPPAIGGRPGPSRTFGVELTLTR